MTDSKLDHAIATSILAIDTVWGGDVMNPSGTGRFIADSWCSDEPLPEAYSHARAAAVRAAGGLSASEPDRTALEAYIEAIDVPGAIGELRDGAAAVGGPRGEFLAGLGECLEVMWDLALEVLDRGEPVPYERSVLASTAAPPTQSDPRTQRERLGALLGRAGYPADNDADLLDAADAWRGERMVPPPTIPALGRAFIAELDAATVAKVLPHLPAEVHGVPRSNVEFLAIKDAWFSGSMNYVGRARTADGRPEYEATYEINASLEISVPEFVQLVSHEVVPGHVTTFAYVQHLYTLGKVGFEGTILTMNSRYSTLAEGIANNAILMAHGVTEIDQLPDEDLQIGTLLALLQDDAKNQASYLTWQEGWAQPDVEAVLRRDFVVSEERAGKLSGPWAKHPILGRMYLPAYRAGTEKVAELRRVRSDADVLPALYGCRGLVDVATVDRVL
ncbi:MAG: hypothetical protein LJE95_12045 [Acidobacteria bacterium]|nr:hypothetical protein [Acidobacteriota bacterium]